MKTAVLKPLVLIFILYWVLIGILNRVKRLNELLGKQREIKSHNNLKIVIQWAKRTW